MARIGVQLSQFNIVKGSTGIGKNVWLNQLTGPDESALFFAPTKALVAGIAAAVGAESYLDNPGAARCAVTPNSAHKITVQPRRLVGVDENPAQFDAFFSEKMAPKAGGGRSMFCAIAQHVHPSRCEKSVWLSDDNTEEEVAVLTHFASTLGIKEVTLILARRESAPRRAAESYADPRWRDLLAQDAVDHVPGGPPLAIFTSNSGVDRITGDIKAIREKAGLEPLRILPITGDTNKQKETAELLAHPNRITGQYDVVLYTTAASHGVSIEGLCRRVYVEGYVGPNVNSVLQAPARFRNQVESTVRFCIQEDHESPHNYCVESKFLCALARSQTRSTQALVSLAVPVSGIQWDWASDPEARTPQHRVDGVMLLAWLMREIQTRKEANDRHGEFVRLASARGWDVVDLRAETVDTDRKVDLKDIYKAGKVIRVEDWHAEVIAADTNRAKIERSEHREAYGQVVPTAATMGDGPKDAIAIRQRNRDYLTVWALACGDPKPAKAMKCEDKAALLLGAVEASGVDIIRGGDLDEDALSAWLAVGDRLATLQVTLGTTAKKPGKALMRALGGVVGHEPRDTTRGGVRWKPRHIDFSEANERAQHLRSKYAQ